MIALLCVVGVVSAVGRSADAISVLAARAPVDGLTPLDRASFEGFARHVDARPGTAEWLELRAKHVALSSNYSRHPGVTLMHTVPGALFLLLAPFQFSRRIRTGHPRIHRAMGRVLLVLAVSVGASALFFGLLTPYGGALEASAIAVFGTFFLIAAASAYRAIRSRDVPLHREWMTRLFAAGLAISTIRLLAFVAVAAGLGAEAFTPNAMGLYMWAGWLSTLSVAELWIRRTRDRGSDLAHVPRASLYPDGEDNPVRKESVRA